mgnify:CR=1 FL=1|jgi:hypothetical protein
MATTQREVIQKGYAALVQALGPVDAIRFIQHFSPGKGNYTEERHQWLDQVTAEEFFAQMQQVQAVKPEDDLEKYEEIIE